MTQQGFNPYLPSWEYVPDGEPHVFGNRVYVYGSHDRFNGYAYCLNDYVCWSAPVTCPAQWRYEGIIYRRNQDPANQDGEMCLFAPDVTQGSDGRYYLYYVLNGLKTVSVAVCDTPAGEYKYYGTVHYEDGTPLGEKDGDPPQFDPGVYTENDCVYMYTGFCPENSVVSEGACVTVLNTDMLTVKTGPVMIVPGKKKGLGTSFEGHEFFEASSMRKIGENYYFIYSSVLCHELCYAISHSPVENFVYGGVIISNNDMYIDTYKPWDEPGYYGGNNHGSLVLLDKQWYVFYHRHTNGTNFSRQGCMEPVYFRKDQSIIQAEMTSCGSNHGPLLGYGYYPSYIACVLFCRDKAAYTAPPGGWMDCRFPKITQDGRDGDKIDGYIANMRDGAVAGFKYFSCKKIYKISVICRGYAQGEFRVKTSLNGDVHGCIPIKRSNEWKKYNAEVKIPDGKQALYFEYFGQGNPSFASFELEREEF